MGTFFGEIIELPSRAFWDDEDAPVDESVLELIQLDNKLNDFSSIDLCMFVQGYLAEGFVQKYLLNGETPSVRILEKVVNDKEEVLGVRQKKEEDVAGIYALSNRTVLCVCKHRFNVKNVFCFVEKVAGLLRKSQQVVVLTSKPVSQYFHTGERDDLEPPFLRQLHTDSFKGPSVCVHLEQPNIITELPAQVLTFCQATGIPGVLYVCYSDSYTVDSLTVKPFVQLMRHYQVKVHNAKQQGVGKSEVPDSLYM